MNFQEMLKRPVVVGIVALVLGLAAGLIWAWGIQPAQWYDAPANLLRPDLQDEYLRMSIDSYRVNGDENLAIKRFNDLGDKAQSIFQNVKANPGKLDPNFITVYEQMLTRKGVINPVAATPAAPASNAAVTTAIILGGLLAVAGVLAAAFWLFRGNRRRSGSTPATPAMQAAEITRTTERTDFAAKGQDQPVAHYVTTYVLGDDLYDDSFSIDSPSGEFLGECGAGISESMGVGDPKKVTAFEVWMFDKNDIQTVTKVLMSPRAFADPVLRAKLEAKGELIELEPQKQIVLETQTLQMSATVADMQLGQGNLPDGSYFDRVTLELAIWSKK